MIDRTQSEIMSEWREDYPLVSIRCITYNHEKYIAQALDGFLIQKTNFPFEIVIHDDASTDNTAEIIRSYEEKYPLLIHAIYEEENLYSKHDGSLQRKVNSYIRGKYIAFCEGDDYWIDENKLQMQYDFMKSHSDYVLCYTNFNIYFQTRDRYLINAFEDEEKYPAYYTLEEWILEKGYLGPMTWLYRKDVYDTFERLGSLDGTFEMFAHFLASGKVKCLKDEITAVHRILPESAAHTTNIDKRYKRCKSLRDVQKKMVYKYKCSEDMLEEINRKFYNSTYKIICAINDVEEKEQARLYCTSHTARAIFLLSNSEIVRKAMRLYYKIQFNRLA